MSVFFSVLEVTKLMYPLFSMSLMNIHGFRQGSILVQCWLFSSFHQIMQQLVFVYFFYNTCMCLTVRTKDVYNTSIHVYIICKAKSR